MKIQTLIQKNVLLKNISWTFFGNVIYSACQWAILSIIAKVGSSLMLGEFNLAFAIVTPVFLFSSLQLRSVITTDQKKEYHFKDYFQLRFLLSVISLLSVMIISIFLKFDFSFILLLLGISLIKFFESINDILYGKFQQNERFAEISKSLIYRGFAYVILYFTGIYFFNSLIIGLLFVNISLFILLLVDFKKIDENISFDIDRKSLITLSKKGLPLGIVVLLIALADNIPKYFIEYHIGTKELGFYTSIVYITIIGSTVINAFGQASMTRLSLAIQRNDLKSFIKLQSLLFLFTLLLGITLYTTAVFFGERLLVLLYNEEFFSYYNVFKIIMFGSIFIFLSSILGYGITAARYFKIQPVTLSIVLIANSIFCYFYVSEGLIGISKAYLFTGIINLVFQLTIIIYIIMTYKKDELDVKSASYN